MERCPNCRARYREGTVCNRCGMDLSLLLRIEEQAKAWERLAVARLAIDDRTGAEEAIKRTLALQHRSLALLLQEFMATRKQID